MQPRGEGVPGEADRARRVWRADLDAAPEPDGRGKRAPGARSNLIEDGLDKAKEFLEKVIALEESEGLVKPIGAGKNRCMSLSPKPWEAKKVQCQFGEDHEGLHEPWNENRSVHDWEDGVARSSDITSESK